MTKFRLKHTLTFYIDVDTDVAEYESDDPNDIAIEHTEHINNGDGSLEDVMAMINDGDQPDIIVEAVYAFNPD